MKRGVLVALAIVVAATAGFFVQRHFDPAPTATAATTSPPDSPHTAAADEAATPALPAQKIPDLLPQLQLPDLEGKKRSLKDWSGRPLMVNFWATWCGPCRKEIPLLNQIRKQRESQKLEIIGISLDFRDDVIKYEKEIAITYPLLIGEEDVLDAMKAFGMENAPIPFTFFADSKQRIVAMKLGELHQDEADLILDRVKAIDAGTLDLKRAREQITEGMKAISIRREAEKAGTKAAKAP